MELRRGHCGSLAPWGAEQGWRVLRCRQARLSGRSLKRQESKSRHACRRGSGQHEHSAGCERRSATKRQRSGGPPVASWQSRRRLKSWPADGGSPEGQLRSIWPGGDHREPDGRSWSAVAPASARKGYRSPRQRKRVGSSGSWTRLVFAFQDSANRVEARRVWSAAGGPGGHKPTALIVLVPGVNDDGICSTHLSIRPNEV